MWPCGLGGFPYQPCACYWLAVGADTAFLSVATVKLLAQSLQPPHRFLFQPAVNQFLNLAGEAAFEIAAVERRRLGGEEVAPLGLQIERRGGFQRS